VSVATFFPAALTSTMPSFRTSSGGPDNRDFHFDVAFAAAQIPGIANRIYSPMLAGPLHPDGIRIGRTS